MEKVINMISKEILDKFNNLKNKENVIVFAVESSCDETSIAVIKNGREKFYGKINKTIL